MLFATATAFAQDATSYFNNKPFGWGTCTDPTGTPYNLNGGFGYGNPKTITLTATGTETDGSAINDAVKKYDVVILDGSKGDFIIPSSIKFKNLKNKTIVGYNNARLRTKFELTAEIHAKLKAANLEKLSSTSQITGTLPNGQEVTMDERAFYTKKTMMEATGDYDMTFAKSGIFQLDETDENFIIRNLTLIGPGAVDIDGVDLISQYGANYVWIDHCTFIDGQDGSLDSGKRSKEAGYMFVTYSWNKFSYTSKSFSHPYSNGTGWMNGNNHQYITYANCWWSEGCGRRLPQADDVDIHVLNCYHDCRDNGAAITINNNSNALIEGCYAESWVNSPVSFANGGTTFYTTRDNYFPKAPYYNAERVTGEPLVMPYEYMKMPAADVPNVLTAEVGGAGATLSNEMAMPDVQANTLAGGGVLYNYIDPTKENNLSTITFGDGAKLVLSGNASKAWSSGTNISYNDTQSMGIKLSNGAENTFYAPAGKKVNRVKFISYFNAKDENKNTANADVLDPVTGFRKSYWALVGDKEFTFDDMQIQTREGANPHEFACDLASVESFKFKNSGEQLVFLLEITYDDASGINSVTTNTTNTRAIYNLAGQRISSPSKSRQIYIVNGKKVLF